MKTGVQDRKASIIERFRRHVSSAKADFFKTMDVDFVLGRREGAFVWDATHHKRLIDCHGNGGVFNLGHRHAEVIAALQQSLLQSDMGNHHLISEPRARLAERLAHLLPGDLTYTVFASGGGEAIDLALKLARGVTRRQTIISASGGYHGHTGLALSTGDPQYRDPFGPNPPGFVQVAFNDVEALASSIDDTTAAVIFETVPATFGSAVPDPDFYPLVRQLCDQHGALFIIDEVQTGLGRTGRLWGIEHYQTVPDMMVIGKGLSGGIYPMAATCFGAALESFFQTRPFIHISTFGGAEVGCPVAMRVLDISSRPQFLTHVAHLAKVFKKGFEQLRIKHPQILVRLRQLGLMMGIEMVDETCGPILSKALYDNGILSVYANNDTRVCQLQPPLIIDDSLACEILERIDAGLDTAKRLLELV
jgi:acetylornithine/succinyldiaminopimelate/putrescine aminotransferase